MNSFVLDEQLIDEVQNHAVIYNRQKYFLNHGTPASKDEAWNNIAIKLRTDVESCKKRWKYLRERYVQQRKQQTDTPTYEHLSRPYLEKMTFLDEHIQPRKSYRYKYASNSSNNTPFGEFVDSSRSNGSINSALYTNYHDNLNVKPEPEQSLHSFSVGSDQQAHPDFRLNSQHLQAAQNMQEANQQQHNVEFRDRDRRNNIPSSSSSLKSPLSSPPVPESNENGTRVKRPRVEIPHDTIDDDGDSSNNDERQMRNSATPRYLHRRNSGYPNNMLYSLNQQFPGNGQEKVAVCQAIADNAAKDLEIAMPALRKAEDALKNLNKSGFNEIKSFTTSPLLVQFVMEAVCMLLDANSFFHGGLGMS